MENLSVSLAPKVVWSIYFLPRARRLYYRSTVIRHLCTKIVITFALPSLVTVVPGSRVHRRRDRRCGVSGRKRVPRFQSHVLPTAGKRLEHHAGCRASHMMIHRLTYDGAEERGSVVLVLRVTIRALPADSFVSSGESRVVCTYIRQQGA